MAYGIVKMDKDIMHSLCYRQTAGQTAGGMVVVAALR
jgi:hypothetical protein